MPTRNINLTQHLDAFIERHVSSGRYSNASEIVRAALRLLEEYEQEKTAKLKALQRAARQGFDQIDQGQGIAVKSRIGLGRLFKDVKTEVLARAARNGG
jgi:antitoxin ParD1/3/4